jgi:hypothetical protein
LREEGKARSQERMAKISAAAHDEGERKDEDMTGQQIKCRATESASGKPEEE